MSLKPSETKAGYLKVSDGNVRARTLTVAQLKQRLDEFPDDHHIVISHFYSNTPRRNDDWGVMLVRPLEEDKLVELVFSEVGVILANNRNGELSKYGMVGT